MVSDAPDRSFPNSVVNHDPAALRVALPRLAELAEGTAVRARTAGFEAPVFAATISRESASEWRFVFDAQRAVSRWPAWARCSAAVISGSRRWRAILPTATAGQSSIVQRFATGFSTRRLFR